MPLDTVWMVSTYHVSWLGLLLPNPTPQVVAVLWTVCAACACLAALNVHNSSHTTHGSPLHGIYFESSRQLPTSLSQTIILVVLACLPARAWMSSSMMSPARTRFHYWDCSTVRFMYFWTAVAKIDSTWLSGITMMSLSQSDTLLMFTAQLSELVYGTSGPTTCT